MTFPDRLLGFDSIVTGRAEAARTWRSLRLARDAATPAALALLGCAGCASDGESPTTPEEPAGLAAIDAHVDPYVELALFDGAILVARDGEVLHLGVYGSADHDAGVPHSVASQFRIASVSKPFTEMAVGTLIEAGHLDRDTRLSHFLPDFPRADEITVGHLLDNRSGVAHLNDLPWYDQFTPHDYSLMEIVELLAEEDLDFSPGTQHAYTNGGYALMAYLIEAVSGRSYGDYLESEIFAPLDMHGSGHDAERRVLPNRAEGHYPGIATYEARLPAPYVEMTLKIGGGSLFSTIGDLYRWDRALFHDNVLSAGTYEMLFPVTGGVLTFSGRQPGFNAFYLRRMVEDLTVIVLSNNYGSGMLEQVAEACAAVALGQTPDPPIVQAGVEVPMEALSAYAGLYQGPLGELFDIRLEAGRLVVHENDEPQELLVPVAEDRFLLRVTWAEIRFVEGEGGVITHAEARLLVNDQIITLPRVR